MNKDEDEYVIVAEENGLLTTWVVHDERFLNWDSGEPEPNDIVGHREWSGRYVLIMSPCDGGTHYADVARYLGDGKAESIAWFDEANFVFKEFGIDIEWDWENIEKA